MKKYLIRVIGALCILGAAALMFLTPWATMDGIARKDLRKNREDISNFLECARKNYVDLLDDEDFKDDMKDADLPSSNSKAKALFRKIENISTNLLDNEISLMEVMKLSWNFPGILKTAENLADSGSAETFFACTTYDYYDYSYSYTREEGMRYGYMNAEDYIDGIEEASDALSGVSVLFYAVAGVFGLILLLAVLAAATHILNKFRWVKYLFLAFLVLLVAGSCVLFPMVSEVLGDSLESLPTLSGETLSLSIAVTPFIAVALMIVPIVLDIKFERKKQTLQTEA